MLLERSRRDAELQADQVSRYLDAGGNSFDGVLTISNAITATPAESPVQVDGRS